MRVLVIDDEVRKAEPLVRYLRHVCEWYVEIASGPDEAMRLLKTATLPYNVIILDIMMDPGTVIPRERSDGGRDTGLLLLEMIIARADRKEIVILYTARTDLGYLRGQGKVAEYVQKPGSAKEIARIITDLVGITQS